MTITICKERLNLQGVRYNEMMTTIEGKLNSNRILWLKMSMVNIFRAPIRIFAHAMMVLYEGAILIYRIAIFIFARNQETFEKAKRQAWNTFIARPFQAVSVPVSIVNEALYHKICLKLDYRYYQFDIPRPDVEIDNQALLKVSTQISSEQSKIKLIPKPLPLESSKTVFLNKLLNSLSKKSKFSDLKFYIGLMDSISFLLKQKIQTGEKLTDPAYFRKFEIDSDKIKKAVSFYLEKSKSIPMEGVEEVQLRGAIFKSVLNKMPVEVTNNLHLSLDLLLERIDKSQLEKSAAVDSQVFKNYEKLEPVMQHYFRALTEMMLAAYHYSWEHVNLEKPDYEKILIMVKGATPIPYVTCKDLASAATKIEELQLKLAFLIYRIGPLFPITWE